MRRQVREFNFAQIYLRRCAYVFACTHVCVLYRHARLCACACARACVRACVCVCVCVCVLVHVRACMRVCVCVCVCVCVHVLVHVRACMRVFSNAAHRMLSVFSATHDDALHACLI
jgi:hypothetical protein